MELTDRQQAILMFIAVVLPSFVVWLTNPEPLFAELSLRYLIASIMTGVLVGIKEIADYKPKETT